MGRNPPASSSNGDASIPAGHGQSRTHLPPPPPSPKIRQPPREKTASQEALELLKKGTQRIIEADGLQNALLTGGLCLGCIVVTWYRAAGSDWLHFASSILRGEAFANAMVADMKDVIDSMKAQHKLLQESLAAKPLDSELRTQCDLMKAAYSKYDDKMKVVKRSLRPPPKAKAKTAPKAAALPTAPST